MTVQSSHDVCCPQVSESDGQLSGTLRLVLDGDDDKPATITMVSVPSRFAGRGIGKALVRAAERHALQSGKREIGMAVVCTAPGEVGMCLETTAPIGPSLVTWYERQGYSTVGMQEPCYWTEVILESLAGKVCFQRMQKLLAAA